MYFIEVNTFIGNRFYASEVRPYLVEDRAKALLFPVWEEAERVRQQLPHSWVSWVAEVRSEGPDRFQRVLSEDLLFLKP